MDLDRKKGFVEKMSLEQTDLILRENGMYSEEQIERLELSSLQLNSKEI